jgi:hypothetical protein
VGNPFTSSNSRPAFFMYLKSRLCTIPMGDEDKLKWNVSKTGTFSCSYTLDSIRVKENVVDW